MLSRMKTMPSEYRGQIFSHQIWVGGSFGMSLEGDCHEVEVTPNLTLLSLLV